MTRQEAVDRAKSEILEDVGAGVVPETVASAAELHDYVDANGYGGAFEAWTEGCAGDRAFMAFWNGVHDDLDAWIKAGGVRETVARWREAYP